MMRSCLACYSTLMMEAICSSEGSVDFHRTTRPYISEDRTLHNHSCENLKSTQYPFYILSSFCLKEKLKSQLKSNTNANFFNFHTKIKANPLFLPLVISRLYFLTFMLLFSLSNFFPHLIIAPSVLPFCYTSLTLNLLVLLLSV
jgi:hypothetical protein